MFNDAITAKTLDTMHRTNLRSGTTSFLPTLITTCDDAIWQAMDVVQNYRQSYPYRVLGLHLEGPYLNPSRRGIHDAGFIRPPDSQMVDALTKAGSEVVKLVTLAPEVVSAPLIRLLVAAGIVVSAGHTEASFETALAGFDAGISMVTHLFNAMSPWLGRTPGVVGAALSRADVYAGVIADGHHVHYGSIQLAHRIKQDRLFLVTDATPPAGAQVESFVIGGQEVFYKDGKCVSAEGTLGGSALTMIEAVQNCVQYVNISLAEALRMATLYPAQAIGMAQQLASGSRVQSRYHTF
ncbi:MAG: N-acetylglucosamine-6-phosphate deacetylase [Leptolyngbyaceae cyanobacterium SM2_5_2]|nr:N-acetylglucosamine-6-phosphate deacetylase [Leptolyngbyaceae cyanobacterium SM2_5_2]